MRCSRWLHSMSYMLLFSFLPLVFVLHFHWEHLWKKNICSFAPPFHDRLKKTWTVRVNCLASESNRSQIETDENAFIEYPIWEERWNTEYTVLTLRRRDREERNVHSNAKAFKRRRIIVFFTSIDDCRDALCNYWWFDKKTKTSSIDSSVIWENHSSSNSTEEYFG